MFEDKRPWKVPGQLQAKPRTGTVPASAGKGQEPLSGVRTIYAVLYKGLTICEKIMAVL